MVPEILSLAWRTDLALLAASGSQVEHHPGHVVVRTPDNPGFRWGSFVLWRRMPAPPDLPGWLRRARAEHPTAGHLAIGLDDPHATAATGGPLAELGFDVEVSTVLTTSAVRPPPRSSPTAVVRPLAGDDDWRQRLALSQALDASDDTGAAGPVSEERTDYAARRVAAERRLAERGAGGWFGAFEDGVMVAGLGIFLATDGLARFQDVQTRPDHRGRGLAGTLVHAAGRFALGELGARRLVIVADPGYHAIRVYERVGFTRTETQLEALLPLPPADPDARLRWRSPEGHPPGR